MNHKMFLPMVGDKVKVVIPDGLPELSMSIIREMLHNPPENECSAYLCIADFLKRLLDNEHDSLLDMIAKLNKTTGETYIDGLLESGYAFKQLEESATVIQRRWKLYKSLATLRNSGAHCEAEADNSWASKMIVKDVKTLENFGISTKSSNEAATVIQRAWRKHFKSVSKSKSPDVSVQIASILDEYDDYESDDIERVNVVRKNQVDYVPPIPDFIPDTNPVTTSERLNFSFEDQYEGTGNDSGI